MALVFQPISHNKKCDRAEEKREQNQYADCLIKSRPLVHEHKFITVL